MSKTGSCGHRSKEMSRGWFLAFVIDKCSNISYVRAGLLDCFYTMNFVHGMEEDVCGKETSPLDSTRGRKYKDNDHWENQKMI